MNAAIKPEHPLLTNLRMNLSFAVRRFDKPVPIAQELSDKIDEALAKVIERLEPAGRNDWQRDPVTGIVMSVGVPLIDNILSARFGKRMEFKRNGLTRDHAKLMEQVLAAYDRLDEALFAIDNKGN